MEFPQYENIRKVIVGDLKEGMTYEVGTYHLKGQGKITKIIPFDVLAYHTQDRVLMFEVYIKNVDTDKEYKWFDLSLDEVSKIEYDLPFMSKG